MWSKLLAVSKLNFIEECMSAWKLLMSWRGVIKSHKRRQSQTSTARMAKLYFTGTASGQYYAAKDVCRHWPIPAAIPEVRYKAHKYTMTTSCCSAAESRDKELHTVVPILVGTRNNSAREETSQVLESAINPGSQKDQDVLLPQLDTQYGISKSELCAQKADFLTLR